LQNHRFNRVHPSATQNEVQGKTETVKDGVTLSENQWPKLSLPRVMGSWAKKGNKSTRTLGKRGDVG